MPRRFQRETHPRGKRDSTTIADCYQGIITAANVVHGEGSDGKKCRSDCRSFGRAVAREIQGSGGVDAQARSTSDSRVHQGIR